MDRIAKSLFAIGLLLLPCSYALKQVFGIEGSIWIDPTLIVAPILYLATPRDSLSRASIVVVFTSIILGVHGFYLLRPDGTPWQAFHWSMRMPIQLTLCMLWFVASGWAAARFPLVLVKWLTVAVVFELFAGIAFVLPGIGVSLPLPSLNDYSVRHLISQARYINGFWLPRLCGTFDEGPIFGMFMSSALIMFVLMWTAWPSRNLWLMMGLGASLLGVVGALSDEVFLGVGCFAIFACGRLLLQGRRVRLWAIISSVIAFIVLALAVHVIIARRSAETTYITQLEGTSFGERVFNVKYGLERIVGSSAEALLLGVGPDRFGDYAVASGEYDDKTVTLQFTPAEWLVGYGVIGTLVIAFWLCTVGYGAYRNYGLVGLGAVLGLLIANIAQSNWVSETWFMALGCLYIRPPLAIERLTPFHSDR